MSGPGAHSPLGASGAPRWMKCAPSVQASEGIEDEESDHAALGTAVHELIELAMVRGQAPWTLAGQVFNGFPATPEMVISATVWVDEVNKAHLDRNQGNTWIERRFHCPSIHDLFYGTSDLIHLDGDTVHIWDFKNGAGVVVEPTTAQLKYYAVGAIESLGLWRTVKRVVLHVVQPNAWHWDGPHRTHTMSAGELTLWLESTLIPAMNRAQAGEGSFVPGEHCRFCPARQRQCPALVEAMAKLKEVVDMGVGPIEDYTPDRCGEVLELLELAKIVKPVVEKRAYNFLNAGKPVPGYKLAQARANRQWREGAEREALARFGTAALTTPELKSPAEIEKMPAGSSFTAEYAFKPNTGVTLTKNSDGRAEVSRDTKSLFKPVDKPKSSKRSAANV